MRPVKTISDPLAFKLLADDTRRKIISLLRVKELNVAKIAELLELTPQTVYHHIKMLEDGGLVESTREERISANLLEKYYQATAEVFYFSFGDQSHPEVARHLVALALGSLKKIGFKVEYDEATVSKLANFQAQLDKNPHMTKYLDEISKIDDIDQVTKWVLERYVGILSMSDKEFAKFTNTQMELWNLLRSLVKEKRMEKSAGARPLSEG